MTNVQKTNNPTSYDNTNKHSKLNKSITIREPENNPKHVKILEVPSKGKGKIGEEIQTENRNQQEEKIWEKDKRKKKRRYKSKNNMKGNNNDQTSTEEHHPNSFYEKGQISGIKNNNVQIFSQKDNNQTNLPQNINIENMTIQNENKVENSEDDAEIDKQEAQHNIENEKDYPIDPGEVQNNYLKLISETSEEEGEEYDESKDHDYEEEMSSKHSDEFASVESESFSGDDEIIYHDKDDSASDDHDVVLVETICSQSLVEVDVTSNLK
ncbi:hypothetical protein K7X08_022169 [Anisodus acutangulus]|uniref:Uncharacterized protein n=1 Tax=Anisodus acutangulus TaxID=402998 RepID=A0A9Q1L3G3_9SOLA|nr:hypothetical protein K7X08_022169 [Anisodus acutangulus]